MLKAVLEMKRIFNGIIVYLVFLLSILSCSGGGNSKMSSYPTIPAPLVYEEYDGAEGFHVCDGVCIVSDERIGEKNACLLADGILGHCIKRLEVITRHAYSGEPHSVILVITTKSGRKVSG